MTSLIERTLFHIYSYSSALNNELLEASAEWDTIEAMRPPCSVCGQLVEPDDTHDSKPLCAQCSARTFDYAQRTNSRIAWLQKQAASKQAEAQSRIDTAHNMASIIPWGQPILVGHHSEGRDRRYRAKIDNNFRKGFEALDEAKRLERSAETAQNNTVISSDDPLAVLKLEEKIAHAEKMQADMKAANQIIRSKVEDAIKIERLIALGFGQARAESLLKPDIMGNIGFASYALTNNNSNIRRMKERLADLRKRAVEVSSEPTETETDEGVKIIEDPDDNRIRLVFKGVPPAAARAILKSHGWRWSPSNGAWQRQLTNAARANAIYVLREINGRKPEPWQVNPTEVKTEHVQFWRNGVLVTSMAQSEAQQMVQKGEAFVITSQAIGALVDGQMRS